MAVYTLKVEATYSYLKEETVQKEDCLDPEDGGYLFLQNLDGCTNRPAVKTKTR
jgi:hypothetical protein